MGVDEEPGHQRGVGAGPTVIEKRDRRVIRIELRASRRQRSVGFVQAIGAQAIRLQHVIVPEDELAAPAIKVAGLFAQPDVDGFLVGGASLDPQKFLAIIRHSG